MPPSHQRQTPLRQRQTPLRPSGTAASYGSLDDADRLGICPRSSPPAEPFGAVESVFDRIALNMASTGLKQFERMIERQCIDIIERGRRIGEIKRFNFCQPRCRQIPSAPRTSPRWFGQPSRPYSCLLDSLRSSFEISISTGMAWASRSAATPCAASTSIQPPCDIIMKRKRYSGAKKASRARLQLPQSGRLALSGNQT